MTMREYETMYILSPELSDDETNQTNQRLDDVLEREGANVLRRISMGKRKLAYEIKKQPKGIYFLLNYLAKPEVIKELERNLKSSESKSLIRTRRLSQRGCRKISEGDNIDHKRTTKGRSKAGRRNDPADGNSDHG